VGAVNCLEPHPLHLPCFVTSGLENHAKLWTPGKYAGAVRERCCRVGCFMAALETHRDWAQMSASHVRAVVRNNTQRIERFVTAASLRSVRVHARGGGGGGDSGGGGSALACGPWMCSDARAAAAAAAAAHAESRS
jgi:predicted Fe-S protein YdhL (DUF1289 family)